MDRVPYSTVYRLTNINYNVMLPFFPLRLVGDNIDHEIRARVQTKEHGNRSIHWTHQFAVLDRVQGPEQTDRTSQKPVSEIQFAELLPDGNIQATLVQNWAIIVSRVITKYLKSFQYMKDVVIRHIPHQYSKEMSEKSTIVS